MINDRLHDKLQQLANGELDPKEEESVRAEMARNSEAHTVYTQYAALKADMNFLQDVPPDQLSKERLRARLLGEALKPERPAPIWTWFWMPTMAAALAFVVYFNRTKPADIPTVVGSPELARTTKGSDSTPGAIIKPFLSPEPTHVVALKATPSAEVASSASDTPAVKSDRASHRHSRHPDPIPVDTQADSNVGSTLMDAARSAIGNVATISPRATALAAPTESNSDSIVVISNSVDADTGAQHATEETASNVLTGG